MSFSLNKLRSILPGQNSSPTAAGKQFRNSVSLEPEIGFQIFIESTTSPSECAESARTLVPELNVVLLGARHLPTVFGFKIVQGYNIKVKLFPGSKRFDSSVQTNSWPKFNESFKFLLAPDIKPSIKTHSRGKSVSEFLPDQIFAGHFVVFTVYALLELPPASFNRFNRTYRSLKERSSTFVQKVLDTGATKPKEDESEQKVKNASPKIGDLPQLTVSESKRNIGSVTCYLEPKIFKRSQRTGNFCTEELWLPIKDINTTILRETNNLQLSNSTKGIIEIILEIRDSSSDTLSENVESKVNEPKSPKAMSSGTKPRQWTSGLTEVTRLITRSTGKPEKGTTLCVTTNRMRCSNKVKDDLESLAGNVYVKTTILEHNIYSDSWKSSVFFPSLSTKWDSSESTVVVGINSIQDLDHILIKVTLATKNKIGKKIVLGTATIGSKSMGSGVEHWEKVTNTRNEKVPMWHSFE